MNDWVKDVPVGTTVLCRTDGLREAFTRLADEWAASSCSGLVEEIRALLAAHPAEVVPEAPLPLGATWDGTRRTAAEALCLADMSWEHHDRTDDFPCSSCVSDTRREDVALVETAARALYEVSPWVHDGVEIPWCDLTALGKDAFRDRARAVLAVLPVPPVVDEAEVRERIAQEIEASILPNDDSPAADWLRTRAARIARGATSG